ncbi:phosphoserine phosphatase [[Candida] jaroonii]|uniref:Phosphoserine phosphatase n=1 Tax=[Candida] jaroonii TaxID=467808 RepID=A0ACA9YAR6_9ASCO|nr:phosphoserine phosphatase [[Candida] jaroonii]
MTHVLTVISHTDSLDQSIASKFFSEWKVTVTSEKTLSSRATDYFTDLTPQDVERISNLIKDEITKDTKIDIILQSVETRTKKLVVFDMDSTLIYQEVIELIAAYANIEDKVAEITERAMNGELDFNQSLYERVKLLKGINSTKIWDELKTKIQITEGVPKLCKFLVSQGFVLAVCSGGFIQLANYIKETLQLNYAHANVLGVDDNGVLDGTVIGEIVNGDKKAELLLEISKKHNIDNNSTLAIGDGANDLKMMSVANFGIAWNAKPKVQKLAPSKLNSNTLSDVLYILGYTDEEINRV